MSPARRLVQSKVETRLAQRRVERGMTQREVWRATGISRTSYLRLERKDGYGNPPLRYLSNCAIVLGCELEDLIEPEWHTWELFDFTSRQPADPSKLWHGGAVPPTKAQLARAAEAAWAEAQIDAGRPGS
jgi:DNA-binding XRE family transcriptional regulator